MEASESLKLNEAKVETFADKLIGMLNNGALAVMTSIGHRTGLFDTMQNLPPATSNEIAEKAGLNERYVREWLGAMVVGGVVEYYPQTKSYFLPPEHAACLTRAATPDNIAVFAQYVSMMGAIEDEIVECFHKGGGVPYEKYERFHDVMAEDSGQTVLPALIDQILPLAPGLVEKLEGGIDVLDVGCGAGRALNLMAQHFPNSRFTGYDLSAEAIEKATKTAAEKGLTNVKFVQKDMSEFNAHEEFDLITAFDAIHDQADPAGILAKISQALHPDGTFLMQDIAASSFLENNVDHPIGPLLYALSCTHCMTVSLAQNGAGLGTMWGEETARRMLSEAGFTSIETKKLPHDFQNNFYINRKSS